MHITSCMNQTKTGKNNPEWRAIFTLLSDTTDNTPTNVIFGLFIYLFFATLTASLIR